MRSVILFVVGLAVASAAILPPSVFKDLPQANSRIQSKPTTCNNQPIGKCTDDFFANFGLNDPHNETVFEEAVKQYLIKNGVAGFANIKTWMQTLYTCSGGIDNLNACIQWQLLMANFNFTKQMAQAWEIEFLILEYETGPGYDVLSHNFYCIMDVENHINDTLQMCLKRFNDEQHNDPNNICAHFSEFLYCVVRPYGDHCGRDVGAAICNIQKITYLVLYPECQEHVAMHCRNSGRK